VDFLRDVGRHFSVNRMLSFDSVKLRLDRQQELSFLEFNYMILQAYDFVELNQRYGCVLQMGGSDQWGNIVNGIDLGRRTHNAQLFALTSPLISTSSGAKMGKTAEGAVWLDRSMISPYEYWQYWRNTDDGDVVRFLKLFTTLPLAEINRLAALKEREIDDAKNILATEATALLHGRPDAIDAAETARTTFEEGGLGETLPVGDIPVAELDGGIGVLNAFVRTGLVPSTSEARRQIKGGGLRVNDTPVTDEKMVLTRQSLTPQGELKLSLGRKRHVLLGRVTERQVASAACKVLAIQPDRTATIKTLVKEIPKYLELSSADLTQSKTRPNEAVWEQQIRNIQSHHKSSSNFIHQGLLENVEGGLRLTEAGLRRLKDEGFL
jgi:tyrosyl-tRNA synthetase